MTYPEGGPGDLGGKAQQGNGATGSTAESLEALLSASNKEHYVLRLFVTGTTPQSALAILNIKAVCEKNLKGRYDLEVIDIYQQPELANSEQIIAAPTLIKMLPQPLRKLIGNLSDTERVLVGLGLESG